MHRKLLGINSVDLDAKSQLMNIYSAFVKYLKNSGNTSAVLDFKKSYESVRKETLYNILIESGIPMNLIRLILLCLNLTCSGVRVGKHLSHLFLIKNSLKKRRCFIAIILQL